MPNSRREVVCVNVKDLGASLTVGKVYEILEEKESMIRIVDDTGGDYWHDASRFEVK